MDKLIYTAMTGAKHALMRQDTLANNLANANTAGFRAESVAFRSVPVQGVGAPTRAFVVESTPRVDFTPGAVQHTGRELDVAVSGRGWVAVQGPDGTEGYTRAGSLQIDSTGVLQTAGGLPVLGDGGPIIIPQDNRITIAADGTVSATPNQPPLRAATPVGRIKLVNPPEESLRHDADGLFRVADGGTAEVDENVRLIPGAVEGSNVNVAEAMIGIIAVARQFDLQMKMMQNADTNARAASQLLSVNS
jgi:flagellar basal-body rod protein FlgF